MDRLKLNGIIEGTIESQAVPDATLQTIGFVVIKEGQRTAVADGNLTITANSSGNPRVDMVEWDGNALSVLAGTPGASPNSPSPTAGSIPIALVWVPDSFTTVNSFTTATDTEAVIIALYYAVSGMIAIKNSLTDQTITGADENLPQIQLPLYFTHPGQGYEYETNFRLQNVSLVAKASLISFHLLDGVKKGFTGDKTLTARDSGTAENVTLIHRNIGLLAGPITVGAHRITVQASRVNNNVLIDTQSLAVMQIR